MAGDPATLDAAEKALDEADGLLPGDARLMTNRALLAYRRGELDEAASRARLVLGLDFPDEHPRASMVLLDTLLARYWTDGRVAPELVDLLEGLFANPAIEPGVRYACALAAYRSHAGDDAPATRVLREAAGSATGPDESAAIGYHLAYVLARSGDAAALPEIDRILAALPAGYPSRPARSHTIALRHLTADDPEAALAEASRALDGGPLAAIESAEVHLTMARAYAALGRRPEAARSRDEASRYAPHHQLLDPVAA